MNAFKSLFKQTFIYGLATVLPRMLSFLLVPLYTDEAVLNSPAEYGQVSIIFSYFVLFNVFLAYGMETAFFRFYNKEQNKASVVNTASISLGLSSILFLFLALVFKEQISDIISIDEKYVSLVIYILFFDALTIIPFAWLRAVGKPIKYAVIKLSNVVINIGLNLFFLLALEDLSKQSTFLEYIYIPNFQISYIFIANLVASLITFMLLLRFYASLKYKFNFQLWKRMLRYAFPILIAGIAFSINETFDRILLDYLLPKETSDTQIGMYSACYKLAVFMTLFATAFRLGIEPYFFSHSKTKTPQFNYARILESFVALGALILVFVVVFADILKPYIIRSEAYWEAMWIVPIILIANFCLGIYHNLSVWYKVTDKTKYGAYISVLGGIITVIINIIGIPLYGYKASAIATLIAYATMVFVSYFLGRKHYPIPYNLKKICSYLGISITCSLFYFYNFRGNYLLGALILVLFLIFLYISEKKQLQKLLKS